MVAEKRYMHIGLDFDNTIICYDKLFHKVSVEQGLIEKEFPKSKGKIRDYLREVGKENAWTEMQGYVYGKRIIEADMFPGVIYFLKACKEKKIRVKIVSHKTRYPYMGKKYDLHKAARKWMNHSGLLDTEITGLSGDDVYFEPTKEDKIKRIDQLGCTHFIDDLPEFLSEKSFPDHIGKLLFDPEGLHISESLFKRVDSWGHAFEWISQAT